MHEEHIFSYICVHVPVRSLYVLKSRILCIQYERVCTFTDTSWKWHFYGHYDGVHDLWLLTHTRCLQDGSIDYIASNDLRHHCSRLSELEICPQSENRCCADLSPKLPVSQLVTQPIQPWPSLLTALSPVAGGAGALWQLTTGGADQKRCVHWLVRVDIMMIKWLP